MSAAAASIRVCVNDETRQAAAGERLLDFIAALGLTPAGVLIERNGEVLLKDEWEQVRLADGDRLEILRVVAGG